MPQQQHDGSRRPAPVTRLAPADVRVAPALLTADISEPAHRRLLQEDGNQQLGGVTLSAPVFAVFVCLFSCAILCPLYVWFRSGMPVPRRILLSAAEEPKAAEEVQHDAEAGHGGYDERGGGESAMLTVTKPTADDQISKLQQVACLCSAHYVSFRLRLAFALGAANPLQQVTFLPAMLFLNRRSMSSRS